ncbi:hypothetical protein E3U43_020549 [Larimichthys crocea]|uniref:Uncharacterized protein n=1 Tax=Larimichthys crocea TaxID=215358 RepID=A0ACD3Q7J3_LARCR|nr:hypothetical protein E3U43_020549 [Larimichthys crocea]
MSSFGRALGVLRAGQSARQTRPSEDNNPKSWRWTAHRATVPAVPTADEEPEGSVRNPERGHVVLDPVALLARP